MTTVIRGFVCCRPQKFARSLDRRCLCPKEFRNGCSVVAWDPTAILKRPILSYAINPGWPACTPPPYPAGRHLDLMPAVPGDPQRGSGRSRESRGSGQPAVRQRQRFQPARGRLRQRLERLARYCARPPLAIERLEPLVNGRLLYRFKRPWSDGTTHVVFEGLELLERLSALVPAPRTHLVRYSGILAPAAKWRARIVPTEADAEPRPIPDAAGTPTSGLITESFALEGPSLRPPGPWRWSFARFHIRGTTPGRN